MKPACRSPWFAFLRPALTGRSAWSLILLLCLLTTSCRAAPAPPASPLAETTSTSGSSQPTPTPIAVSPTPAATSTPTGKNPPASPTIQPTPSASAPTPAASPTPAPPRDCQEQAVFVQDITIPDGTMMEAGEKFTKTWRIQNSGTCDWGDGYSLVFSEGDIMNGNLNSPFNLSLPAGQIGDLSIDLQAPQRGGEHTGYWKIQNPEGQQFGAGVPPNQAFWVSINVNFYTTGAAELARSEAANPAPSASPAAGSEGCNPQQNAAFEAQVLDLINTARISAGLEPLSISPELSAAAQAHSQDMACNNFVDHSGSDGSSWQQRVAAQGYANAAAAHENIYVGNPALGGDPQGAFNWWMNSPIHRDNILYPVVSEIGIGYVYNPNSDYGGYYTTVFARP